MSDPRPDTASPEAAPDKTYRPAEIEAKHSRLWESAGAFRAGHNDGKPYTIVIPPPNVTGKIGRAHV